MSLLFDAKIEQSIMARSYGDVFRRVYYHLYSNSRASRAETIVADLANLLLCKVAAERSASAALGEFRHGKTSSDVLMPLLRATFPQLIHEGERFRIEDAALRRALDELEHISFASAPGHVLGDAYEALIGPRLRGDKGQFFTPRSLVRAMVRVVGPSSGSKIVDPACGTGGFLAEAHAFLQDLRGGRLIGVDKDADLAKLAESMIEMVAPGSGIVLNQNSLDMASLRALPSEHNPFDADFVLTNPPFGSKIKITDTDILRQFRLGHRWTHTKTGWVQTPALLDGQDPQVLFVELCVELLRLGGRLGIVLPEGIFGNKGQGYVWSYLYENGRVEALIDCPRTTFQPGTDTKTNVLVYEKGASPKRRDVWLAVALHCGHDRRGRSLRADGSAYPDDFRTIGESYGAHTPPWQKVRITRSDYFVPRYYDTSPIAEIGRETVSIGELVRQGAIVIKKGHEVGAEAYGSGDVPFVRTSDISNYEVSIDPTKCVSDEIYEKYRTQQDLKVGDILMICDGRYRIGRTAILNEMTVRCVVQSHVRIISVTQLSDFTPYELLYLLNLPAVQRQVRNLIFIQSTLGSLGQRIKEIRLPVPKRSLEWKERVGRFREIIETRARLLHEVSQFEHGDLEL